ncbi:MAG: hypothetical protein ABI196_17725, partial [Bradyrhizobium sp.]
FIERTRPHWLVAQRSAVQVGSKVVHDKDSGAITGNHTITRPITPECGCLWCNQLINRAELQEEAQTERERQAKRYVEEQTIVAPSVITLNAVGAAQAANDFLFYMTGLASDEASTAYLRFDPRKRSVSLDSPRRSWDCTECGIGPRPFGTSCGDLLSQTTGNGGLGLGTAGTSAIFLDPRARRLRGQSSISFHSQATVRATIQRMRAPNAQKRCYQTAAITRPSFRVTDSAIVRSDGFSTCSIEIAGSMAATSILPPPRFCTITLQGNIVPILSSAISA